MHENIAEYKKYLIPTHKREPILMEGKGVIVRDINNKEYLDFAGGPGIVNVGHCHPKVIQEVQKQVEKIFVSSSYNVPSLKLAYELSKIVPKPLKRAFFCNSGAESVEGAVKLAKKHAYKRGRLGAGLIALQHSFHGRLGLSLTATGIGKIKKGLGNFCNFPGVVHAPAPYCYRCPLRYPDCNLYCAKALENIIDCSFGGDVAAFIYEPILGGGGVIVPPNGYHSEVAEICRNHDIPLIVEEYFCGFGRTGRMFACEHWKIEPDIMTIAKGLGGGIPIAAVMATEEVANALMPGDHYSTFGGNAVACAAALAVLEVFRKERLPENAAIIGNYVVKRIEEVMEKHSLIGDVRGKGLLIGIELVRDRHKKTPAIDECKMVENEAIKRGVLVGVSGTYGNVLRISPPLIITEEQAERGIQAIDESLTVAERSI